VRALAPVCALVSIVVVTGCTGSSQPSSDATPSSAATSPSTSSAPSTPSVASPTIDGSPTTAPPATPTAHSGAAPTCATSALRLNAKFAGAAAGSTFQILVVENISDSACSLFGYPGASFLGTDGNQLGPPAQRDREGKPRHIRLAPGDKANARLRAPNPEMFPESDCRPEQATAVRVYPPDQTAPLQDSTDQTVCTTRKARPFVSFFQAGSA
jgi:hypothetical protein